MAANTAAPPTPQSQWLGHRYVDNNNHTYFFRSSVCHPALVGHKKQNYCTEMLHWDHYCAANQVPPAGPSMKDLFEFIPFSPATYTHVKSSGEVESYVFNCVAIAPCQHGANNQNLSMEMIHFDDYMVANPQAGPQQTVPMRQTFGSFYGNYVETTSNSGETQQYVIRCIVAEPALCGSSVQNYSLEMQHWDDYCSSSGTPTPSGTMRSMCT